VVKKTLFSDEDYINFLTAIVNNPSCVKAADCYSDSGMVVSHDLVNRFLTRQLLHPDTLWNEVKPFIEKRNGWLILDDTVIDKIYSQYIEMTQYQWSGKFHKVVKGIGLVTLVWTDGTNSFPVDYRIYDKKGDGLSKNEHFRAMLQTAVTRNFQPYFVLFDSWYSSNDNLTFIDKFGWNWCTRAKQNRMVNLDRAGNQPVSSVFLPDDGRVVHMKKYGLVRLGHSTIKMAMPDIG
jgi:Transposase DDE domain.